MPPYEWDSDHKAFSKECRKCGTVDHNHETNKVRGILCPRCNSMLGQVENTEWLNKAQDYLHRYELEHANEDN